MNIPEMLEFIDEVVEEKTGKPLTDLQALILEGTLKGQKYSEIGHQNGFSEGHVRDVGYELLQLLSNIFEKPLNKKNLRRFLEKQNTINNSVVNFGKKNKITYSYYENTSSNSKESEAQSKEYQEAKYQVQIEIAKKLKDKGLRDVEVAEILEIEIEELSDYLR